MNSQPNIGKTPIYINNLGANQPEAGNQQLWALLYPRIHIMRDNLRQKKSTLGEHLALLSVKYSVYPNEVFQALVSAKQNEKAVCGSLAVEYRGKLKDETIFLITKDNEVIAQFRVEEECLLRKDNSFDSWMDTEKIKKKIAKQSNEAVYTQVKDLYAGMKHVNLKADVLEIPTPMQVHTQFGNTVMVVNAVVGDDTGKIKLCLWEGQIDKINAGDSIELKNGQVCVFRGEKQLRLGKNGSLTVLKSAQVKPQVATIR